MAVAAEEQVPEQGVSSEQEVIIIAEQVHQREQAASRATIVVQAIEEGRQLV